MKYELYYDCFTSYHTNGKDPSEMIFLTLQYLEEELLRYVEIIKNANEISNGRDVDDDKDGQEL
jgi:hypothetical protein